MMEMDVEVSAFTSYHYSGCMKSAAHLSIKSVC